MTLIQSLVIGHVTLSFLFGGWLGSLVIGVGLWALLPRGAVLTYEETGRPDEWEIKNASAVNIRLLRASFNDWGPDFSGPLHLRQADDGLVTVWDPHSPANLSEMHDDWSEIVLVPGQPLHARISNNNFLEIHYRRNGIAGHLERRTIRVHGGV